MGKIAQDNGYLTLFDGEKHEPFDELLPQKGRWKGVFFHYVHCADPGIENFTRELDILRESGVFNERNIIDEKQWQLCKKMGSCKRS